MKFENRQVTWSTLELTGLLEDEESHVHFTRTVKHLALHPYHLNNVQRGLNQILKSSLNSYDRELKGFVLAFKNPKLLSNLGEMLYDSPFIHIDIEVDFYLFRPTIGSFLKGIVKKKGLDHIVVLVHKIYTVSIPKPDDTEEWVGESVEIGQEVKCCVNQIDNRSKPPFICATLRSDYSQGCRLSENINNIDNVDSAIESKNSSMKIDDSANGVPEDNDVSETERKKHRKKHKKSRENNSSFVCKVENKSESKDNLGNDISRIIKSEKKQHYQSIQDTILNTDDPLNNLEIDNSSKKHKKRRKTSESLLSDDTILDKHTELRKAVKRENSIPLDSISETETKKRKKHAKKSTGFYSENEEKVITNTENTIARCIKSEKGEQSDITETETKKRKKHAKKSREFDSENEEKVINNTENTISKYIKSEKEEQSGNVTETETKKKRKHAKKSREFDSENEEKVINNTENTISRYIKSEKEEQHMHKKHISNTDLSSSSLEGSLSKKHKKKKKVSMKMSDSESEGHFVKIKIEKEDPFIERIINESQTSCSETQNLNNLETPKIKREVSIEHDSFESERKKNPKKHTVTLTDSQLKSAKIKNEDST